MLFRYISENIKHNSYEPDFDNIENVKKDTWKNNEGISQGSRAPTSPSNLTESNSHGGSWVDNFRDMNGIEKTINLKAYNFHFLPPFTLLVNSSPLTTNILITYYLILAIDNFNIYLQIIFHTNFYSILLTA